MEGNELRGGSHVDCDTHLFSLSGTIVQKKTSRKPGGQKPFYGLGVVDWWISEKR